MEQMAQEINGADSSHQVRILFVHHSTGRFLISVGGVRKLITARNQQAGTHYEFWDHDYNKIGLTTSSGKRSGISFDIPDDNTDPDGLETLFSQPINDPANNALSRIMAYDVIVFKSCFPVSAIHDDAQLERYKRHYLAIRQFMARHPEKLFIVMTPPPLIPKPFPGYPASASTKPEEAKRARLFSQWLQSDEFLANMPNVATFDFFDLLAEPDNNTAHANMLRPGYRSLLGLDSHPSISANKTIAPLFVEFVWTHTADFLRERQTRLPQSTSF